MSNHVKNQHFVPRFMLNYFADSERNIWCYNKLWKRSEKKGVGGVAFEQYFYDRTPGMKEGSLEYIYQRAETDAAPIIQKIINKNSLKCITLDEKIALAMFIVMQLNRTKSALKNTENIQKQFWEPIKEFVNATGAQLNENPVPSKDLWLSAMNNTPRFTEIIMQKVWFLASSNNAFYTSDHPIVRGNYKHRDVSQIRGIYGLNSDGIEIYFPLTPSLLLCIFCERSYPKPTEELVQCTSEHIVYANHLQVIESDVYVFSADNDFALVEDMILKGEV
jgi:hypothetical protein